jgi:hypothetical protein
MQFELDSLGVATVAIVSSPLERARLYFKYRPTKLLIAADPDRASHRPFGIPTMGTLHGLTQEQTLGILIDPTGELGGPTPAGAARRELSRRDGYETTPEEDEMRSGPQGLAVMYLIDAGGVIRWRWVEAMRCPEDIGTFPRGSELLTATRSAVSSARTEPSTSATGR